MESKRAKKQKQKEWADGRGRGRTEGDRHVTMKSQLDEGRVLESYCTALTGINYRILSGSKQPLEPKIV